MPNKKKISFEIDENGCFNCTSHSGDKWGYTKVRMGGSKILTHRFVYEQCYGEIPEGLVVRHKCDNPKCINPEHLELGTIIDNNRDMVERKRHRPLRGVNNPKSLFTREQVLEIDRRIKAGEVMLHIAKEFGVSHSVIHNIKTRKKYKDILEGA